MILLLGVIFFLSVFVVILFFDEALGYKLVLVNLLLKFAFDNSEITVLVENVQQLIPCDLLISHYL